MPMLHRCAIAGALAGAIALPSQAGTYKIVDLGPNAWPAAINLHRDVAGIVVGQSFGEAAKYQNGSWHALPPNDIPGSAGGINGHGDVAGVQDLQAIFWKRSGQRIVVPLPESSDDSEATAVSQDETIVGDYLGSDELLHCYATSPQGPAMDLGMMLDGDNCEARAVNRSGEIAGAANRVAGGPDHAFLWRRGKFDDLGVLPGGSRSSARAVNDHELVVGASDTSSSSSHAFKWVTGSMKDLDPKGTYAITSATAVSNNGAIVGVAQTIDGIEHAVRFDAGGVVTDLQTELAHPGDWVLQWAGGINADGVIVGGGSRSDGMHGFMLIPVQGAATRPGAR